MVIIFMTFCRYFGRNKLTRTSMLEGEHLDEKEKYHFSAKLDAEQDFGKKVRFFSSDICLLFLTLCVVEQQKTVY
jgi:hypothetical protein